MKNEFQNGFQHFIPRGFYPYSIISRIAFLFSFGKIYELLCRFKFALFTGWNKINHKTNSFPHLIFLHIPRTGGTTIGHLLLNNYKKEEHVKFQYNDNIINRTDIANISKDNTRSRKILCIHSPYGIHKLLGNNFQYMTIIRNPIDRMISHFYFAKENKRHYLNKLIISNNWTISDYVNSRISEELDNGQVRLISGVGNSIKFGECTVDLLEIAKCNLLNSFSVVGLFEDIQEFENELVKKYKFVSNTGIWLNKAIMRPKLEEIDRFTVESILAYNSLDFELYNWVKKIKDQRTYQIGPR